MASLRHTGNAGQARGHQYPGYAEVAVDVRSGPGRTFSYGVPPGSVVLQGHVVEVPFGSRHVPGFVFQLTQTPGFPETREITRVVDDQPWLSEAQLELARWISLSYYASLYSAASLMIPAGFRQRVEARYQASEQLADTRLKSADDRQREVLSFIQEHGPTSGQTLARRFGRGAAEISVGQLVRRKLVQKQWAWLKPKIGPLYSQSGELAVGRQEALAEADRLEARRAFRQAAVLRVLASGPQRSELPKGSSVALRALGKAGLVRVSRQRVERDPLAGRVFTKTTPLALTPAQELVWEEIYSALGPASATQARGKVFLLHGVTGSGKTELYLRALERVVSLRGRGIVLVPEISLTPQTIERFSGRFPGRVAVLHSRLSPGQQFDQWWRVRAGEFDVVVGSRGAVFAPQPNLRLIVLDEEHEWTYKQQDPAPRYHAREVAVKMAELTGATVLLGSATPQVESFSRAARGDFRLLELPERIAMGGDGLGGGVFRAAPLPNVHLVDMRAELKAGNRSVFSRTLRGGIQETLTRNEQVILFLNRRGAANFVQCRDCGHVIKCRRCSAAVIYHAARAELRCHQCNYHRPAPMTCPHCWGPRIRYVGMGTEALEVEVVKAFADATTMRWDSDVTQGRDSHEKIMRRFLAKEADILIGTQMIAKGLHLPGVTLVGVVNADIGLYSPDFRASERVFQVLCQVAGRSGRGEARGTVIVQTYSPDHYAIQAAARQDYDEFYQEELHRRMEAGMPPFSRLARLVYGHPNAAVAREEAERVSQGLQQRLDEWAYPGTRLIGPAPAPFERVRGRYRWHVLVVGPDPLLPLDNMTLPEGWTVDIDPMHLL